MFCTSVKGVRKQSELTPCNNNMELCSGIFLLQIQDLIKFNNNYVKDNTRCGVILFHY